MDGVQFKEILQTVRERWPSWTVNTTEIKDLNTVFMGEAKPDVEQALFIVRKKYSSDVPRLPWFYNALDQIKGERNAEAERVEEEERLRQEMLEREFEDMECRKEHAARLQWIRDQSASSVSKAMQHCVKKGYIREVGDGQYDDWSTFTVGMVYTYMNR